MTGSVSYCFAALLAGSAPYCLGVGEAVHVSLFDRGHVRRVLFIIIFGCMLELADRSAAN